MSLYIVSLIAGILTILAPCVLPTLPIILGGGLQTGKTKRIIIIVMSFVFSVILFTGLIKASTIFSGLSSDFRAKTSGILIVVIGIFMLFPNLRTSISSMIGLEKSNLLLHKQTQKKGLGGDILLGITLGPVFTSCSPTYGLILGIILPISLHEALINISFFAAGIGLMLFLIGMLGIKIIKKLRRASNPQGWFKKILAGIIILTGIAIFSGLEKQFEIFLLDKGLFFDTSAFEQQLIEKTNIMK